MANPHAIDTDSFWGPIESKIEQRHKEALDLQSQQRESWMGLIKDPNTSDEIKSWAWDNYQKSLDPQVRKKFSQVQPIIQHILGGGGAGQDQAQQGGPPQTTPTTPGSAPDEGSPQPAPAAAPAQSAGGIVPVAQKVGSVLHSVLNRVAGVNPNDAQRGPTSPPPGPIFDTNAANQRKIALQQQLSDIEEKRQVAVQKAKPQPGTLSKPQEFRNPNDPSAPPIILQQQNRTGKRYDLQGNEAELPDGYRPYAPVTPGARKEAHFSIDGKDTIFNQDTKTGQLYDAVTNKPVTLPENAQAIDEAAKLALLRAKSYQDRELINLADSYRAENPDLTEDQAMSMAGQVITKTHEKTLALKGAEKTHEILTVVNGQIVPTELQSRTVPTQDGAPVTPPARGAAQGSAAGAAPVPAPSVAPRAAPRAGGAAPAASASRPGGRVFGMPLPQYKGYAQDAASLTAGAGAIFGDPNTPQLKSLKDYADLADDKEAMQRIGTAVRLGLALGGQDAAEGGGANVSGVSVGGIGTLVGNALNVPANVANQQTKMLQEAVSKMSAREREAYNQELIAAEGIIGLRKVTSGGAYKFNSDALQRVLPLASDVVSKDQFNNRMAALQGEYAKGARIIPSADTIFSPEVRKQLDSIKVGVSTPAAAAPKSAPSLPVVKSQADFDKLKPGDWFIEDGNKLQKALKK